MVNIAIAGAGFMGSTHLAAYRQMPNVCVKAVCNTGEEKGRALAQEACCAWYKDISSMLKDCGDEVDVIDICLPTFLHKESAILAASAGKHVFCEKPAALNVEDFCEMNAAAVKHHTLLCIGHVIRYWPEYTYAKEMLDRREFGDVRYCRATRMACVSKRAKDGGWFTKADKSGGGLMDLHIHDVDYLTSIFGKVKSVYAVGSTNQSGSWNYICSSLNFESGLRAVAEGISEMPSGFPFTMELNIVGENKAFCYRLGAGENLYDKNSFIRSSRVFDNAAEPLLVCTEHPDAYYLELKDFVEHVEKGIAVERITAEDVFHTLKLMQAIKKSLETCTEIYIE